MKKITLLIFTSFLSFIAFSQGATCDNPIVVNSVPYNITDDTSNYGDDYDIVDRPSLGGEQYTNGTGSEYYLTGDDVVYAFTPSQNGIYNFNLTNPSTWVGFWLFEGCSPFTSIVAYHTATSGATRSLPELNLLAGNTYYLVISTWPSPQSIAYTLDITQVTCAAPTSVTFSNVTTVTADFSWTDIGASGGYQWLVLTDGGDPDLDSPVDSNTESAGSSSTTATGLSASTDYDFYIRADCGVDGTSDWVGPINFTTACAPVNVYPYNTDFASCPPNACWVEAGSGDPIVGPGDLGTGLWTDGSYTDNGITYDMNYINLYTTNREDWLISESYDLSSGGPYELNYHVRHGNTTAMTSSEPFGSDDYVQLLMSTDGGANWTVMETWDTGNDPDYTGLDYNLDLSAQTGTVQFAFYGTDGTVDDTEDTYFGVSKFQIREIPNCPDVSGITITGVTDNSANISWTAGGSETDWEYIVQVEGTGIPVGSGTAVSGTPSDEATGLSDATNYEVYVRSYCGGTDYGAWIGPVNFTTSCVAVDSFSENFDSVSTPDLPTCWSYVIDNGASSFATVGSSTTYSNTSPNSVNLYNSSSSSSSNIILVSPVVTNLSDGTHQLRFFARNSTSSQDIEVGTISDPMDGSTFTAIETVDINTTFAEYTVSFSSYSGSDTHIAIRRLSTSTYTNVYLDDIVWEVAPTDTLDYYNLQWPPNGNISYGDSYTVYAQAYEAGLTDVTSGQAPGIVCWIGYSSSDTDPSGTEWTWALATFNNEVGNNDEYMLDLGAEVNTLGTLYYASRWSLNGGPYTYGGIQADGSYGGQWGIDNNISGILMVDPVLPNDICSGAIILTPGLIYDDNPVDGTVAGATNDAETNSCGLDGPGVWYSVVVPNDGNINIETGPDSNATTGFDSVIEAFSGTCGALVSIDCDDDGADTGNYSLLELSGLTPGETIYIRVWEYNGDESEPFSISAYSGTLSAVDYTDEIMFSYYPNPVNSNLNLKAQKDIESISVVNMLGQEVLRTSPNTVNSELDMSGLSTGSYFVRVTVEGITETVRVVKQ